MFVSVLKQYQQEKEKNYICYQINILRLLLYYRWLCYSQWINIKTHFSIFLICKLANCVQLLTTYMVTIP